MRLGALLLALMVSGCAASDYSGAIADMSVSVEQSVSAIEALDAQLSSVRNQQLERQIVAGTVLIDVTAGECVARSSACSLSVEQEGGVVRKYPVTSVMPNAIRPLRALKEYVSNLEAIVAADTAVSVTANANKTLGNLVALQDALPSRSQTLLADYSEPVSQAVNWIIGEYVEHIKVSALSDAVIQAEPIIQELDSFYAAELEALREIWVGRALKEFAPIQTDFDGLAPGGVTSQHIERYRQAAADFEIALSATYTNPIASFAKAHTALAEHFKGGANSLTSAQAAIVRLKAEADRLKEIVDAFTNVSAIDREE